MPKPKRPKSHETQTRAEQIFEWMIGPEWTASPTKKDYGIDYEVEVFSGGEATGLTFKAQVKGHSNKPTQPKAVIKQSALNLWAALDVPVLIVSVYILSETEYKVYARWAHSYDPYPNDSKAVKTRTVRFEHDDLVGPAFPLERIQAELEAIRNARRSIRGADQMPCGTQRRLFRNQGVRLDLSAARYRAT